MFVTSPPFVIAVFAILFLSAIRWATGGVKGIKGESAHDEHSKGH